MSDSNRSQLGFIEETTIGACPATALTALRFTDESLNFDIENISSNEIFFFIYIQFFVFGIFF